MNKKSKNNYGTLFFIISMLGLILGLFYMSYDKDTTSQIIDPKELLTLNSRDHIEGLIDAKVILVEYLDFECESCRAYFPVVKKLKEKFGNDLTIVYRYFPLPGHKNSTNAALIAEAASRQGKFLEMKDVLFQNQQTWGESRFADISLLYSYAEKLGLNMSQFRLDTQKGELLERVMSDKSSGEQLGVRGTPSFFLNGEKIQNPQTYEDFETLINAEIIKAPKDTGVKVHEHADIKVYLNGKVLDLGQDRYQSTDKKPLDTDTHLHDGNGNNIHKHRTKKTLGDLFTSIGITFSNECFVLDTGEKYCNDKKNTLKFFVNGKESTLFGNYELVDLDKILITYGNEESEEIKKQIENVSDQSCLYSEKCPERGKPPTENCAVGLGGDC